MKFNSKQKYHSFPVCGSTLPVPTPEYASGTHDTTQLWVFVFIAHASSTSLSLKLSSAPCMSSKYKLAEVGRSCSSHLASSSTIISKERLDPLPPKSVLFIESLVCRNDIPVIFNEWSLLYCGPKRNPLQMRSRMNKTSVANHKHCETETNHFPVVSLHHLYLYLIIVHHLLQYCPLVGSFQIDCIFANTHQG